MIAGRKSLIYQRNSAGGKSGLHRIVQGVMPLACKRRNSGTERMSRAMSPRLGTGSLGGAAGVKTAKLCTEQEQIGRQVGTRQKATDKVRSARASGLVRQSLQVIAGLEEWLSSLAPNGKGRKETEPGLKKT